MKKLLAIIFVMVLILSICPFSVFAIDTGRCGENVQWSYDWERNILEITGTGPMYDYDYASDITPPWEIQREYIQSIVISDGVTKIGNNAFLYCTKLSNVTVPSSIATIGKSAFSSCKSLSNITLPNGVKNIEESAFAWCENLIQCTLPNSIITIGNRAFESCKSITNITIPNGATTIGEYAFFSCERLSSCTLPSSITSIGKFAFNGCYALANIALPSGVATIQSNTFAYCKNLTHIEIPYGVKTIESNAFSFCTGIQSINISNTVETIKKDAFYYCINLKNVTIPDSVSNLDKNAFPVTSLSLSPNNPYYLMENGILFNKTKTVLISFPQESTNSYVIPNTVTEIAKYAFESSQVTSITIPNSVTTIKEQAFAGSNISTLNIPNSVTTIESGAFCSCQNLKNATLPNSITKISESMFAGCENLTSITIPNSVTIIEDNAFGACYNLKSVTIPDSVTNITGDLVFQVCNKLTIYGGRNSCAETYAKSHNIPFIANDHNHTYGEWTETKSPTCTGTGAQKRVCSDCSYSETATIDALGHDFQNSVTIQEPSIATKGISESTCTRCGETIREEITASFTSDATGVVLEADEGVFQSGTEIVINKISSEDADYKIIENSLKELASQFVAYDISAILNNAKIQPNGQVKITLAIPENFSENIGVFFVSDKGTNETFETTINENGTVSFTTTHFSAYVIGDLDFSNAANNNSTAKSNLSSDKYILLISVIGAVLIAAGVTAFIFIKKKVRNNSL